MAHAVGQTITDVARADGRRSGVAVRQLAGKRPGRSRLRSALVRALAAAGYEPRADRDARSIELQNCPFRALSTGHRNLTCGMNVAWAEGVVDGLGDARLEAEFTPRPGACCVTFKEVAPATSLVTRSGRRSCCQSAGRLPRDRGNPLVVLVDVDNWEAEPFGNRSDDQIDDPKCAGVPARVPPVTDAQRAPDASRSGSCREPGPPEVGSRRSRTRQAAERRSGTQ